MTLASFRRRWPEAALIVALAVVAVYTGLAWRAIAIVLAGGVATFAIRRRVRDLIAGALVAVGLLLGALAVTFTVDLGQVFDGKIKQVAEREGTKALERPLRIGRLSIRIVLGRFVVEDLKIEGRTPTDVPFFTAKRILVDFPWWRVAGTSEFYVRSVEMSDWAMQIEKLSPGDNLPPGLKRRSTAPKGPKRFTTTVAYLHAYRGQFSYIDRGTWRTTARNLDIYLRRTENEYRGTATVTDGSTQIKDYAPMRTDMRAQYKIEGSLIRLPSIDLDTDGAHTHVVGYVDFGHWPEMVYNVDSHLDLWRMREIYFANESWRSRGPMHFVGVFHIFDGGHLLKGDFESPLAYVNSLPFPDLRGKLEWEPHRFEVTSATARFCSGSAKFHYRMAPLSDPRPAVATWDVTYDGVDLGQVSDVIGLRGLRMLGRASGDNVLEWPLGKFSDHRGYGHMTVVPPPDRPVLSRAPGSDEAAFHALPPVYGPERDVSRFPTPTPIGGELTYRFDPEWLEVAPSHVSTERTYVEFSGRTAYGDRSQFPFYARSADWQESDRLLAGVITAFGSPTGVVVVGGSGEFLGTMTKSFRAPLVQGDFVADDMRAWDVVWGHTTGHLSIENGYVDITGGVITRGASSVTASGRFSLGYPRKDGGEEINARVEFKDRPMVDLRHAFQLDDWPVNGKVSGEVRLYGKYTRPFGYGNLLIADATAWGEPFDRGRSPMNFDGNGVRLPGLTIQKAGDKGTVTGAAYVGWDGTYSFDMSGERVALDSVSLIKYGRAAWSGEMHFKAGGASTFKIPRYKVQMGANDVSYGSQPIGAVEIVLDVQDRLVMLETLEAAALGVSGSGKIEMSANTDAELTFRFNRTVLDPYVRLYVPKLSDFTKAEVSGTVEIVGQLANWDRLFASATVEDLRLKLLDYELRNDGPMRLTFENNVVRVDPASGSAQPGMRPQPGAAAPTLRLRSDDRDTELELSGQVDLTAARIDVNVEGKANLAVLQGFSPDLRSSGGAELHGSVTGPLSQPLFAGYAQITDGRIRHLSLPQSIQAINGRVSFGPDGISFDKVTAQIAGGKVTFGGRVGINGFALGALELTASGQRMEFRYPEGFRSTVDADFDLVGTVSAPFVRGTVTVRNVLYDKRIDLGSPVMLALARGRASDLTASSSGRMPPIRFDVHILAPSSLRVENNIAHVVASADLWLRGTYDHPQISGGADVERGEVLVLGRRYLVRRGRIEFPNPAKLEPYFDLAGETLVRVPGQTYVVNVQLTGTTAALSRSITSDPPLSEIEILSLLLGGEANADVRNAEMGTLQKEEAQRTLAATQVQYAAAGFATAPLTRVVEQSIGLDTFQLTPNVGYDPYQRLSPTARLTVGKRISNTIYLTYSRSLNTPGGADQVILLEYDQSEKLSWILSRNEDGTYALDVRVRHVF